MIRSSQMISMIGLMAGCIILVIFPFLLFRKNLKGVLKTFMAGSMVFLIGDVFIRYPILRMVPIDNLFLRILFYAVVSTVLAIAFRVFVLKGVLNQNRISEPIKTGLVLGLGQAAMEAFILGFSTFGNYQVARRINDGSIFDLVTQELPIERITEAIEQLSAVMPLDYFASFLIQAFYVVIYAGFGLMIVRALESNNKKALLYPAIILFGLFASEQLLLASDFALIIRALVIGVFAVIMGYYIVSELKRGSQDERI